MASTSKSNMSLVLPPRLACRASVRRAIPVHCNSPVPGAQDLYHPGDSRKPNQGTHPPNLECQRKACIGSAKLLSVGKQKPDFAQQFFPRHAEQRSNARILQRRHRHPPPLQNRRQPSRKPRAEGALRVKKQPASRVPPFSVRILRGQRNHLCGTDILVCLLSFLHSPLLLRALNR